MCRWLYDSLRSQSWALFANYFLSNSTLTMSSTLRKPIQGVQTSTILPTLPKNHRNGGSYLARTNRIAHLWEEVDLLVRYVGTRELRISAVWHAVTYFVLSEFVPYCTKG